MTKQSLSTRVGSFLKSSAKTGNVALDLACATIEHALGDSGDWTLHARLVKGLDPVPAKLVQAIGRKVGFIYQADKAQPTGTRVKVNKDKIRADNAGMAFLADLQILAGKGKTLQGADVVALIKGEKKEKPKAPFVDLVEKAARQRIKEGSSLSDMIAELQAAIARLSPPAPVAEKPAPHVAPAAIVAIAKGRKPRAQLVAEPAH